MEQGVGYLHLLKGRGYKETNLEAIPMKGLSLIEAEKIFTIKVYGEELILGKKMGTVLFCHADKKEPSPFIVHLIRMCYHMDNNTNSY